MERRTQQERRDDARRRLVRAATKLFGSAGYAGTTLAEIGREAGVSRSLVTYHFGSKLACMEAVVQSIHDDTLWMATLATADLRGLEALEALGRGYLGSYVRGHPGGRTILVAMTAAISSTPELRPLTVTNDQEFRQLVARFLDEAVADGEISTATDVSRQAALVVGLLRGVAMQWLVDPDRLDLDDMTDAALAMLRTNLTRGNAHTRR